MSCHYLSPVEGIRQYILSNWRETISRIRTYGAHGLTKMTIDNKKEDVSPIIGGTPEDERSFR